MAHSSPTYTLFRGGGLLCLLIKLTKDNNENIVYENFCLLEKQINDMSKNMNDEDKILLLENMRKTKELLGYPNIHCY